ISEGHGPADVLTRMNDLLLGTDPRTMATAVVVALDPATGDIEYASAGHPRPVLAGPGATASLIPTAGGAMLGVVATEYREQTSRHQVLAAGGCLVLFTDGLVERGGDGWGDRVGALLAVVEEGCAGSAQDLVDAVLATVLGDASGDDACVLVLKRDPA
ncbi:MAG TPA: PP2C family protein-serine/threonine phosphatase, partial [Actinotalea sp.]|nr:PP2C family protein-serine/threonine phosphatase [Actinotalea sp.]